MSLVLRPFTLALALLALAVPASAAPAIWEVRDADSRIWLFGSFHLLPEDVVWRTPLFDKAFKQSDKVYFEADVSPQAQTELVAQTYAMGFNLDGTLLSDMLAPAQVDALRAVAQDLGVPMPALLTMKPWLAANTLSVAVMTDMGYDTTRGVEVLLQTELPAERKGYLETGKEQLDILAGAPEQEQIDMLIATTAEIGELPAVLTDMLDAWTEGTPEKFAELFLADLAGYAETFVDRLIFDRNRRWVPALETMLANNEEAFVVVGTGHLVGGDSVVDLLEQAGYSIERLQ